MLVSLSNWFVLTRVGLVLIHVDSYWTRVDSCWLVWDSCWLMLDLCRLVLDSCWLVFDSCWLVSDSCWFVLTRVRLVLTRVGLVLIRVNLCWYSCIRIDLIAKTCLKPESAPLVSKFITGKRIITITRNLKKEMHSNNQILSFFNYLVFLPRPLTIHRTAGEVGGHFFNSSLPLPSASQTLRH